MTYDDTETGTMTECAQNRAERGSSVVNVKNIIPAAPFEKMGHIALQFSRAAVMSTAGLIIALVVAAWGWWQAYDARHDVEEFRMWANLTYSREVQISAFLDARGAETQKRFGPVPLVPKRKE